MSSKDKPKKLKDLEIPAKPTRSVWEVVTRIPHRTKEKATIRCSMFVVAEHIDQIWEFIAADRMDANTEVVAIGQIGPIVAILPNK